MKRRHSSSVIAAILGICASVLVYYGWTESRGALAPSAFAAENGEAAKKTMAPSLGALSLEARLGNAYLKAGEENSVFVSVNVRGFDDEQVNKTPAHLALVIDRSGSMTGAPLEQAKGAAINMIKQLQEGDQITVVTYDDRSLVLIPNTVIGTQQTEALVQQISSIQSGGGTCIACGLEGAEGELNKNKSDRYSKRTILLSDGRPDGGESALGYLDKVARRMESAGVVTSTVGIGLQYNEKIMGQIAVSGNGSHYFAEDAALLSGMLEKELNDLRKLVARQALVTFKLSPGVHFDQGFDRVFQVEGDTVRVPLGDVAAGSERTVLMKLRVDPTREMKKDIVQVSLRYEDTADENMLQIAHTLTAKTTTDFAQLPINEDLDVMARVEQSEINETIVQVNEKIKAGDIDSAQELVEAQTRRSHRRNKKMKNKKVSSRLKGLESVKDELEKPAAKSAAGRERMMKGNMVDNNAFAR